MRRVLISLLMACAAWAQRPDIADLIRFRNALMGITSATGAIDSAVLPNVGAGGHLIVVDFPTAGVTVSPVQVRLEASLDGTTFFPISADITSVPVLGGRTYALQKANGTFRAIRVGSKVAIPAGVGVMNVYYSGSAFPYGPLFVCGDRWCQGSTGGYDKVTFVVCNGAPCVVGASLTNEYIAVTDLSFRTCYAFAKTAPTGAALIFDVNVAGSSIWTAGQRLQIPAGAATVQSTSTFNAPNVAATQRVTIDIDQIGAVTAGQDVTVTCVLDFR